MQLNDRNKMIVVREIVYRVMQDVDAQVALNILLTANRDSEEVVEQQERLLDITKVRTIKQALTVGEFVGFFLSKLNSLDNMVDQICVAFPDIASIREALRETGLNGLDYNSFSSF